MLVRLSSDDLDIAINTIEARPALVERALVRAVNRTVRWVHVRVSRLAAADLAVAQKLIRRALSATRARAGKSRAVVVLPRRRYRIPAFKLGSARQTRTGVTVRGGRRYDGAFLATMPSGRRGVFERTSARRLPIQEKHLSIVEHVREAMEEIGGTAAVEQLRKTFEHELNFELSRS